MILSGSIAFSKFMGDLNIIFENENKKVTVPSYMMQLEEKLVSFKIDQCLRTQAPDINLKELKQILFISFHFNYSQILDDEFFQDLSPHLQQKLWKVVIKQQRKFFHYFFSSEKNCINNKMVAQILSHINCDVYSHNQMMMLPRDKMEAIYLIKHGIINVFDENYNLLTAYEQHSFFGEYQVMFDLKAGCYFRAQQTGDGEQVILLTICKQRFLEIICRNNSYYAFKHYHDLAILKFKNI
jgi:hypothetical protein